MNVDPKKTVYDPSQTDFVAQPSEDPPCPTKIDEFSVKQLLGRGGFGSVYLAYDTVLQREVALKIPHRKNFVSTRSIDMYLNEARATASLDHSHIIPVYRAAEADSVLFYIVTKRIVGCDLRRWFSDRRPSATVLAQLLAKIADALAYAHSRGVVHRDIKPNNILVDQDDHPYIADFGLAIRDSMPNLAVTYAGTPGYMSPEQVRGEGHRIDGRSDIFSLGVVMYQLWTDHRPFVSSEKKVLADAILYREPEHPCQLNPTLPTELGRICLKCLEKNASDRYQSATELARDLKSACADSLQGIELNDLSDLVDDQAETVTLPTKGRFRGHQVIPKGLRPFDTRDSEFFLQLLPGARDRDGIPEIIRFWISQFGTKPEVDASDSVTVGLIYGPSGCGKSSLVRAGLIPTLPKDVRSIYIQASPHDTEQELLDRIVSRLEFNAFPVADVTDLVKVFTRLRTERKQRTVIFIDQFEQWLATHPDCSREPLTLALRQCDGEFLQCVLMVRDDFWMGVTRLMQCLDITLAEDVNVTAVDLFDVRHAREVLRLFGVAYGQLPDQSGKLTTAQSRFLDAAVNYLSSDGRVICVQLALLTEMIKNESWEHSIGLFRDGGTSIGLKFLEKTFDSEQSPRRFRIHTAGALGVLRSLLPDAGSQIKGAVRSKEDLYRASGYKEQKDFRELLTILDRELHLITPTDRSEGEISSSESSNSTSELTGYQLTHDFLISPIRQWVEFHIRSSPDGKAKMRLEEFGELFRSRPRPQSLPTLTEYMNIRRFVKPPSYTPDQRRMMTAARNHHLKMTSLWLLGFAMLGIIVFASKKLGDRRNQIVSNQLEMKRLLDASMNEAVTIASDLRKSPLACQSATDIVRRNKESLTRIVRAALPIANADPLAANLISDYFFQAPVEDAVPIAIGAADGITGLGDKALELWIKQEAGSKTLIRAAAVLANSPSHIEHVKDPQSIANIIRLVSSENPVWVERWGDALRPLSKQLVAQLDHSLRNRPAKTESLNLVNLLILYAAKDVKLIASLIPMSNPAELRALSDISAIKQASGVDEVLKLWKETQDVPAPKADLAKPWGSPWWCVGERRPMDDAPPLPISADVQQSLDEYESAIADHAIVSHRVPQDKIAELEQKLVDVGYRIASLSKYSSDGKYFGNIVWLRDGAAARYAAGTTAEELIAINETNRREGFLPDSLSAFQKEDKSVEYSCTWVKAPEKYSGLVDADLYLNVEDDLHEEFGWRAFAKRGLGLPRSNLRVESPNGISSFSSVRWRCDSNLDYSDFWDLPWDELEQIQQNNPSQASLPANSYLRTSQNSLTDSAAIWWHDLPVDSANLSQQARREHLRLCKAKLAEGYYPIGSSVSQSTGQTPLFCSTWWRETTSDDLRLERATQTVNLAVTLYRLGKPEFAEECLVNQKLPSVRGTMIAAFAKHQLTPDWLLSRLFSESSPTIVRRSCAMALASYPQSEIARSWNPSLKSDLQNTLSSATDPGLRSTLQLIAKKLGNTLKPDAKQSNVATELESIAGDELVIIDPPSSIWVGSMAVEPGRDAIKEPLLHVKPAEKFAIAKTEVTVAQYLKYDEDAWYAKNYAVSTDCPIINISWFDAAKYCRWLSEQEDLPETEMCYPPIDEIGPGMKLDADFTKRIGYRLPTEVEWEYAARGGVTSGRWFGFNPDLLDHHAWTTQNSNYLLHPVASLLPNDFGIFDVLGNTMEWTQSKFENYPRSERNAISDPALQSLTFKADDRISTRGGASLYQPLDARASQRNFHSAEQNRVYLSFRIARTIRD